jgi:hypothetical protein
MKQVTPCRAKEQAMRSIAQHERLARLPVAKLEAEIKQFVEPVTKRFAWQRKAKTKADYEAFKRAAGSWSDVDTDTLIKNIYEDRRRSNRPPVTL